MLLSFVVLFVELRGDLLIILINNILVIVAIVVVLLTPQARRTANSLCGQLTMMTSRKEGENKNKTEAKTKKKKTNKQTDR